MQQLLGSDLCRLLRQVGYLTSAATATAKAPPKHSSQANFGSTHSSHSVADGHSHGDSESESAHGVCFSAQQFTAGKLLQQRSQDIQRYIHTQPATGQRAKATQHHPQQQHQQQQTTTKFAMSSLAAEPLQAHKPDEITASGDKEVEQPTGLGASCHDVASASASAGQKPCFNTGLGEILQFMELIGNLKVKETSFSSPVLHPSARHVCASIFPTFARVGLPLVF